MCWLGYFSGKVGCGDEWVGEDVADGEGKEAGLRVRGARVVAVVERVLFSQRSKWKRKKKG